MDGEDWCAAVHGVTKSRTRLSDRTTATVHMLFIIQDIIIWDRMDRVVRE